MASSSPGKHVMDDFNSILTMGVNKDNTDVNASILPRGIA